MTVVRERRARALEHVVDHLPVLGDDEPVADDSGRRSRRRSCVDLVHESYCPLDRVRLRQNRVRDLAHRGAADKGDVELGTERGFHVALVVDLLRREPALQLGEELVAYGKLLHQGVELLPPARAQIAVDRYEGERAGVDERGPGLTDAAWLALRRAAAGRGDADGDEGRCHGGEL